MFTWFKSLKPFLSRIIVAGLLLWVFGFSLFGAYHDSLTTDEGIHVASAYLTFTRGERRFDPEHPYLFKYFTAIPILIIHPNLPKDDMKLWEKSEATIYDSWWEARSWTDQWFYQSGNNAEEMIFWMRLPAVLVTIGFAWFVFWLARKWFNEKIALWSLFFFAFNPAVLAHGHLANTDIPVAFSLLLLIYFTWKWAKEITWENAVWVGLFLGIALNVKHSALSFMPIIGLFWLIISWRNIKIENEKNKFKSYSAFWKALLHLGIVLLISYFIIWACYGFSSRLVFNNQPLQSQMVTVLNYFKERNLDFYRIVRIITYILPADYVKGVIQILSGASVGRGSYLLSQQYPRGTSAYFPIIFALKTQIIGLILLFFGLIYKTKSNIKKYWTDEKYLLIILTIGIYGITSVLNKINLGIRHLAPIFALLAFIMALATVKLLNKRPKYCKYIIIITYALPVLLQINNLMGFSNIIITPKTNSYKFFNDSNLDWGQQAKEVANYVKEKYPNQTIYSNYQWNPYVLSYYGLNTLSYDSENPPPKAILVISETQLTYEKYERFRAMKPIDHISNHTFIFQTP